MKRYKVTGIFTSEVFAEDEDDAKATVTAAMDRIFWGRNKYGLSLLVFHNGDEDQMSVEESRYML